MDPTSGISRPKRSSSAIEAAPAFSPVSVLLLLGLGALLGAANIGSRLHLHVPGHQGLIRVTALMAAARILRVPWAATIMASGAGVMASFTPGQGADPMALFAYLLAGLTIDLAWRAAPQWQENALFLALVGAAANAVKPLALWLIAIVTGVSSHALAHGLAYPLAMHLAFGLGGGLAAWGLSRALARPR